MARLPHIPAALWAWLGLKPGGSIPFETDDSDIKSRGTESDGEDEGHANSAVVIHAKPPEKVLNANESKKAAKEWLRARGIDANGDLFKPLKSQTRPWVTCNALHEAASSGELDVCRFLWEKHSGAASIIRAKSDHGETPLWNASLSGHLHVAKWLFDVGAAEDITTEDGCYNSPLRVACDEYHLDMAQWLVLQGAANGADGHVFDTCLISDVHLFHVHLQGALELLVEARDVFASTVLIATRSRSRTAAAIWPSFSRAPKSSRSGPPHCALALLRGLEDSVLAHVADFAGIVKGRQLRNAREAASILNS